MAALDHLTPEIKVKGTAKKAQPAPAISGR
jgi:hypothetical protein